MLLMQRNTDSMQRRSTLQLQVAELLLTQHSRNKASSNTTVSQGKEVKEDSEQNF